MWNWKEKRFLRTVNKCFDKIEKEVNVIEGNIYVKEGFLWFKKHKYSKNDLLNSKNRAKIESWKVKLQEQVESQAKKDKISGNAVLKYLHRKKEAEQKINEVIQKIKERVPTRFDKLIASVNDFFTDLIESFPVLGKLLPDEGRQKLLK